MTFDDLEKCARSIVAACASPGARDVARIDRTAARVIVSLGGQAVELEPGRSDIGGHLSRLKSRVASLTRQVRARAMLDAVGVTPGADALWLVSTSRFATEWLRWTDTVSDLQHLTCWTEGWRSPPVLVDLSVEFGSRGMRLAGWFHQGVLTPTVHLSTKGGCRFTTVPAPSIIIDVSAFPETLVDGLNPPLAAGDNAPRSLSKIVSHPFFEAYDPLVTSVTKNGERLVIGIDDDQMTLAPVPPVGLRVLPPGFDPAKPWAPTAAELCVLRKIGA